MNMINTSMGFSPFQLKSGHSPCLIPPLVDPVSTDTPFDTKSFLQHLELDILEASNALATAKINQSHFANCNRLPERVYNIGDRVMLSTANRRKEYCHKGAKRCGKFMPRFDGPFTVINVNPSKSSYTLDIPSSSIHPTFHSSLLKPFLLNDTSLFPSWQPTRPRPIVTANGTEEFLVDKIVDVCKWGRSWRYLVRYVGEGPEGDCWLPRAELENNEVLDIWLKDNPR